MNFFGFGAAPEIEISFDGQDTRKTTEIQVEEGRKVDSLLFYDGETVSGKIKITQKKPGSKLEHQGIRVELIGQIDLFFDPNNSTTFLSLRKDLARPGDLLDHQVYNFEFLNVQKLHESYFGINCRLRYFVKVIIAKRLSDITKEIDFVVHTFSQFPDVNNSIKMEVGIQDSLHIEFEYNRSRYHLKDVIVGKVFFLLVRIKIKHMELGIIRREIAGLGANTFRGDETIAKFEIMDGVPARGESIPIRVFLAGYDLTPTFEQGNKKFSVRYYLNLALVDEEDRRYFKEHEIVLWRKTSKVKQTFQASLQQQYQEMQNPNVQFSSNHEALPTSSHPTSNGNQIQEQVLEVEGVEEGELTTSTKPADASKVDENSNSKEECEEIGDVDNEVHESGTSRDVSFSDVDLN